MNLAEQVKEQLIQMDTVLQEKAPGLPNLLRTIHTHLKKDPEIVTLLSEDECNILVSGLKEHTKIELACKAIKGSVGGKSLKKTTLEDL